MYKILVCGSRFYSDRDAVNRVLDAQLAKHGPNLLMISGGAVGADELARQWATSRKVNHLILYAKWEVHGKAAGPKRNTQMLKQRPNRVLAFRVNKPGENRGTDNMIGQAERAKIKVKRFF